MTRKQIAALLLAVAIVAAASTAFTNLLVARWGLVSAVATPTRGLLPSMPPGQGPPVGAPPGSSPTALPTATIDPAVANVLATQRAASSTRQAGVVATQITSCNQLYQQYGSKGLHFETTKPADIVFAELLAMNGYTPQSCFSLVGKTQCDNWQRQIASCQSYQP